VEQREGCLAPKSFKCFGSVPFHVEQKDDAPLCRFRWSCADSGAQLGISRFTWNAIVKCVCGHFVSRGTASVLFSRGCTPAPALPRENCQRATIRSTWNERLSGTL